MKLICVTYTLRNGARGALLFIAPTTADAIIGVDSIFGASLRSCSARVA